MKKVIKGKTYNTETAKTVAAFENLDIVGDLAYIDEVLYQKKNGEFFLVGEGGPKTIYAEKTSSNSFKWGRKMVPMTSEEADQWIERRSEAVGNFKRF